jgi:cell division FtsZ-interacting protein ZapD
VVVDKVIKQGPSYYLAIQKSSEIAHMSCSFATDAIHFWQHLSTEDTSDTVKSRLDKIKKVAKSVHNGSQKMHNLFKLVRIELFKVNLHAPLYQFFDDI